MSPALFFLDYETTGLDAKRHGIIQVGWIIEQDGKIMSENGFDVQLYKGCDVNLNALEINDFTPERCMAGKPLEYMNAALREALSAGFVEKVIPIGHNISFDLNFFREASEKTRDMLPMFVDFHKQVDTLALARWLNHTGVICTKNNKLETLCEHYTIALEAHNALSDVKAVRELYHIFMNLMKGLLVQRS
jgi:DNA polymerase III alpha subunit (gram-positive type)